MQICGSHKYECFNELVKRTTFLYRIANKNTSISNYNDSYVAYDTLLCKIMNRTLIERKK